MRREERSLVMWYRDLVTGVLSELDANGYAAAVELARLPEAIRGYEDIKLRSIAAARARAKTRRGALAGSVQPLQPGH